MLDLDVIDKKQSNKTRFALVLGEDSRSFLSVIRSLGRAGFTIHVVCYDKTSISLKSKYITAAYFYNYQSYNLEEWVTNVLCLIERYQHDIIFPCDERAIYPLWQARDQLPATSHLAIANHEALNTLFDKWETKKIAQRLNVPVATGKLIKLSSYSYHQLKEEFAHIFVIKPLQSFTTTSLDKRNKVVIIKSESEYEEMVKHEDQEAHYLIEEYFDGYGEGLSVFAWEGEIKASFSYKRLAEPHFGGGSSYRESNEIDEEQLDATKLICRETKLTGLAMFEFRRNTKSDQWILVEVNARAWGGMPLAEFAGIDFPKLYADHLCKEKIASTNNIPYRYVRARSLITDLYEIKRESEIKAKNSNHFNAVLHLLKRTFNIMRIITPRESIDSLRRDDIRPFVEEMNIILRDIIYQKLKNNYFVINRQRWQVKKNIKLELAKNIKRKIIFVCYGNIIRSPFAEKYLNQQLNKINYYIDSESFGFHKNECRKSPDIAITAASIFNCDLNNHSSRCLSQLDIKESDILFYFDDKNKIMINSYYKSNNAYCLSNLLDNQYPRISEIEDPYESDVETITMCYKKIQNAIDNFIHIHKEVTQC